MNADSARPLNGSSARSLAVFIDADNLNDPTALDHVLTSVRALADRIVYRRAYGRPESLRAIEAVLWRHGVRPVANLIVDKTTTDSALVIDAVESVCRNDIDVVAICSGDADFVPLAMWLRERHCRVLCFSLPNKIFANPESFYDEVVLIDVVSDSMPAPLEPVPKAGVSSAPPPAPQAAKAQPAKPVKPVKPAAAPAQIGASLKAILKALPELTTGESLHLSVAAKKLRTAGLLTKTGSSTALFKRHAGQFELTPTQQPNSVRYRR